MENIVTDSLNNQITMKYEETNNMVYVKNSAVDNEFYPVLMDKNVTFEGQTEPVNIMKIVGTIWDDWSDYQTRSILRSFYENNIK
jgi:hypothetical protein